MNFHKINTYLTHRSRNRIILTNVTLLIAQSIHYIIQNNTNLASNTMNWFCLLLNLIKV